MAGSIAFGTTGTAGDQRIIQQFDGRPSAGFGVAAQLEELVLSRLVSRAHPGVQLGRSQGSGKMSTRLPGTIIGLDTAGPEARHAVDLRARAKTSMPLALSS